ncbi:MAG: tyrosine--tRNA ligase [Patescibacteria group bacterium]|nr:tyrosine--tRNA ligase [Patescibacteria group bacterium]
MLESKRKSNKFDLITKNLEEVLTEDNLINLLKRNKKLVHYIGLEISGMVHLGNGLMSGLKIRDLQKANVKTQILLADWHSWINDKLGGDWKKIREVANGYFRKALQMSIEAVGGNSDKVEFILGSELYHHNDKYWELFIKIARNTTLARTQRSIDIMGRKMSEGIDFAKLCYPIMQVADLFILGVNLAHGGLDQRKAHVIAIDVAKNIGFQPPVALHHHLLLGLQKPPKYPIAKEELKDLAIDLKMSKSKPETCVFIHDSPSEIERKIMKVFCPPGDIVYNPPLDWLYWLILPIKNEIKIKLANGSFKIYSYEKRNELLSDYQKEQIHPLDLKESLVQSLIDILKPIYSFFSSKRVIKYLNSFALPVDAKK